MWIHSDSWYSIIDGQTPVQASAWIALTLIGNANPEAVGFVIESLSEGRGWPVREIVERLAQSEDAVMAPSPRSADAEESE